MLEFESILSASESCCPTHSAMGTIVMPDNCQRNHKKYMAGKIFEPGPDLLLEKFLSQLHCRN